MLKLIYHPHYSDKTNHKLVLDMKYQKMSRHSWKLMKQLKYKHTERKRDH